MFLILILVSAVVLFVLSGIMTTEKNSTVQNTPEEITQNKNGSNLKTFKSSSVMKFSINIPKNLEAEENLGRVTIISQYGKIYIERNGTNFANLKDYLNDLDVQNKPKILEENQRLINNNQGSIRLIKYGTGEIQKVIVIFSEGWIYNFYTNSETLYDDLDQIAQSFRYTP